MRSGILTLTTDFGADGPYVAAMKGVVFGLAPEARLVDVSHEIGPQDVREAGFVLSQVFPYFPPGTVHLAVVDPGVGTDRRLIAALADDQWFVLPDNGLLGEVLGGSEPSEAWEIRNPAHRLASVSSTFHGRDILSPAAAFLLRGGDPDDLGPPAGDLVTLPPILPYIYGDEGWLAGEVMFVDRFGNLITNFTEDHLGADPVEQLSFMTRCSPRSPMDARLAASPEPLKAVEGTPPPGTSLIGIEGLKRTYGDLEPGELIALVGSSGRVEIAEVNGSAARRLGLGRGEKVHMFRQTRPDS